MKKQITRSLALALMCLLSGLGYGQAGIGGVTVDVVWENLSKATYNYPTLQRASGVNGTGKATSQNMLFGGNPDNTLYRNGAMIYSSNTTNQTKKIGFSVTASSNTEITNTIDYGFAFQSNGKVKAFTADESSALVSYTTIDELVIQRTNGEIIFKVSSVEILRVNADPTETLMLRAELISNNSSFSDVKVTFGSTRFIVDPLISNATSSMQMQISGGLEPFTYAWDGGYLYEYPSPFTLDLPFSKGLHQLKIYDNSGIEFERYFLLGNDVSWTSLSNTQQTDYTLSKTTSTGWGSALSTAVIGDEDYFWVQYVADVQQASKAFGVTYTGTTFSQYTNIQAGFMMLAENQLQVIYQGSVVLTTEYTNRDALLISRDGQGLRWLINGKEIYTRTANFTADLKVGGLLKDNASMTGVSSFNINHKPLVSNWSAADLNGSVTVNIASLTSGNSPYHYYISTVPLDPLYDIYHLTRDSVFGGDLDSTEFFEGSYLPTATQHVFSELPIGSYYVSAFDKTGLLIFGSQIDVAPPLAIYNTSGITLNTNLLTAIQNDATTDLDYNIDNELEEASIDFTLINASEKYSMGLSDFNATTIAIQYGFFVSSKTVKFYVNGVLENARYSVKNNNILTLEKSVATLYYKINGVIMREVSLTGTYLLKGQVEIAKAGTTFAVKPKKQKIKMYTFQDWSILPDCENGEKKIQFKIFGPIQPYNYIVYNITVNEPVAVGGGSGQHGIMAEPVINNLEIGVYRIRGTFTLGSNTYTIDEWLSIGVKADFDQRSNYVLSPNDYSLLTNSSASGSALSSNVIKAGESGWLTFTTVLDAPGGFFQFSVLTVSSHMDFLVPVEANNESFIAMVKFPGDQLCRVIPAVYNGSTYTFGTNVFMAPDRGLMCNILTGSTDKTVTLKRVNTVSPFLTYSVPLTDYQFKFRSVSQPVGFKNLLFSFGCRELSFTEPFDELNAGYYVANRSKIGLYFEEEYGIDQNKSVPIKLYDKGHNQIASIDLNGTTTGSGTIPNLTYNENTNKHVLNLQSFNLANNEFYTLEITLVSGEKKYLKFLNKN